MRNNQTINYDALNRAVKAKIENDNLTLREAAKDSSVSFTYLSRLSHNLHKPKGEIVARLCAWLEVPLEAFKSDNTGFIPDTTTLDKIEEVLLRDESLSRTDALKLSHVMRVNYQALKS